jgi:hypothetical protein
MRFIRLFTHEPNAARVDREIDDELAFHFEMAVQELVGRGRSLERERRQC